MSWSGDMVNLLAFYFSFVIEFTLSHLNCIHTAATMATVNILWLHGVYFYT